MGQAKGGDLYAGETAERFNEFWAHYPRRTAKHEARKEFFKLAPDAKLVGIMIAAVERLKRTRSWQERDDTGTLRYVPHARTWIHQRRWEDEVDGGRSAAPQTAKEAAERTRAANLQHVLDGGLPFILGQS